MPRPIDHQLDSIFYTFYQQPKTGDLHLAEDDTDDVDDDVSNFLTGDTERAGGTGGYNDPSESKKESRRRKLAEEEDDGGDDEPDLDDGFGGKKAPPFGSEERKNSSRSAGESTSDDFYGGDKPDDYYDDLNDGPEGEDKHPDPLVQRMRDQEKKNSRRVVGYDITDETGRVVNSSADFTSACDLASELHWDDGETYMVKDGGQIVYQTTDPWTGHYGSRQSGRRKIAE